MKRIAIQGEIGSFHHAAALSWYGDQIEIIACKTFRRVFESIKNGKADVGIVAIENSLHGSINEVYDLLLEYRIPIVGEVAEHIHQCLIGVPGAEISRIKYVHSHPVALSQCSHYLDTTLPEAERVENYDTAASVSFIKELNQKDHVAIASKLAAKLNDMEVLKHDIQNADENFTRFLVIDHETKQDITTKSSLVVETQHTPGALYDILGVFEKYNVNIAKLQSRPIKNVLWRYMFFIDIECDTTTVHSVIADINSRGASATLLGSYTASLHTIDS